MKKIIVACGGAVATSTVVADALRDLCQANNIPAEVSQVRLIELNDKVDSADLVVTTMRINPNFDTPYINGISFLTGIGKEKVEMDILNILKG